MSDFEKEERKVATEEYRFGEACLYRATKSMVRKPRPPLDRHTVGVALRECDSIGDYLQSNISRIINVLTYCSRWKVQVQAFS
jgi:hypothetical protein